ncbi:serine hydrolase domain-containing protein [Phenylobacterium montanum]|uniref:Serine hydrolase n=1 Tax=Phenylobacterium montanum TaxID=2823693 RepID=A0A975ISX6_9CAUL|nr:serine hydrolase [Caulobacter sp. S6]QUD86267.1 serine hydrolase [Caulobacter sp. S6]
MCKFAGRLASSLLCAVGAAALSGCAGMGQVRQVATGLVSHQVCSATFVAGLEPDAFYAQAVKQTISPADSLMRYLVDREHGAVTAVFAGVSSTAVYRGPLGCLVVRGAPPAPVKLDAEPAAQPLLPPIAGPDVVEPQIPTLKTVLDHAFEEPAKGPRRQTKAVVIVRDGRIIAERYAPGYGPETPIAGWSMTKSVTNALLGILVREGRLDMTAPAPIPAWSDPGDPHHAITPDSLLRMASGIDMGQSLTASFSDGWDPTARMVFAERDMAGFAAQAPVRWAPGQHWMYKNGDTLLLSRIIRDKVGGDAASVYRFAHQELFDKLGMAHATLEMDATGTPIGASHLWAPARDWARFGLLYANDGVVGGQRILPEGWVDYSARLTPGSENFGYGAGFWTNRGGVGAAQWRVDAGMPADSFMAQGSYGQQVAILPSQHLVIVRMGYAHTPRGDMPAEIRLVRETLAALKGT